MIDSEDSELKQLAAGEMEEILESIDETSNEIVEVIIPKNDADQRNCTVEIQSAMGGSESSLFAENLVEMYRNYSRLMGFQFKQLDF